MSEHKQQGFFCRSCKYKFNTLFRDTLVKPETAQTAKRSWKVFNSEIVKAST